MQQQEKAAIFKREQRIWSLNRKRLFYYECFTFETPVIPVTIGYLQG
jgi:hypothetical protein